MKRKKKVFVRYDIIFNKSFVLQEKFVVRFNIFTVSRVIFELHWIILIGSYIRKKIHLDCEWKLFKIPAYGAINRIVAPPSG